VNDTELLRAQRALCARVGSAWQEAAGHLKVGIARNMGTGLLPLNGVRHLPVGDTTGWYLWAGETLPLDEDFFQPMHLTHLYQRCPQVLPYLGMASGWRFLLAPNYEDIWFDASALQP
jgi:hypothetical protein